MIEYVMGETMEIYLAVLFLWLITGLIFLINAVCCHTWTDLVETLIFVAIAKPEGWVSDPPKHNNLRRLLVNVTARDNNSVWRKTAAYSCMVLLDFPLSVVYTCTGGILAIPAFHWQ